MIVFLLIVILSMFHCMIPKQFLLKYYFFTALILGTLAYHYLPTIHADLYYHYIMMNDFRLRGWDFVERTHWFKTQPVFAIYSYLISFLKHDGFLPAITVFIAYYLPLKTNYDMRKKYKIPKIITNLNYFFLLSTLSYLSVMGGIRNMLVFSIFAITIYYDLVEKKNRVFSFIIYGLLVLIHTSAIIFVFIRIIILTNNDKLIKYASLFMASWVLINGLINNILSFFSGINIINIVNQQMTSYLNGGTQYVASTAFIRASALGALVLVLFLKFTTIKKWNPNFYDYYKYLIMSVSFIIGSIFQYDIFVRSVAFLLFSSPVIIGSMYLPRVDSSEIYGQYKGKFNDNNASKTSKEIVFIIITIISIGSLLFNTWSEYTKIVFDIF